jgi:hypothetical protein
VSVDNSRRSASAPRRAELKGGISNSAAELYGDFLKRCRAP